METRGKKKHDAEVAGSNDAIDTLTRTIPQLSANELLGRWRFFDETSPTGVEADLLKTELVRLVNQGRNLESLVERTLTNLRTREDAFGHILKLSDEALEDGDVNKLLTCEDLQMSLIDPTERAIASFLVSALRRRLITTEKAETPKETS